MAKPNVIIFDLDGTLSDSSHRIHFLKEKPKNWPAFFDAGAKDPPHDYVVKLCNALQGVYRVIICTGRPDSHRVMTELWLKQNGVVYLHLRMRKTGDYRPDDILKKEMLDDIRKFWNPIFAVDDRPSVVAMYRSNGVPVFTVDQTSWLEDWQVNK